SLVVSSGASPFDGVENNSTPDACRSTRTAHTRCKRGSLASAEPVASSTPRKIGSQFPTLISARSVAHARRRPHPRASPSSAAFMKGGWFGRSVMRATFCFPSPARLCEKKPPCHMTKILLTTTSFQDTPGEHHKLLKDTGWEVITARGPLNEADTLALV